jgi:hypothetical protein
LSGESASLASASQLAILVLSTKRNKNDNMPVILTIPTIPTKLPMYRITCSEEISEGYRSKIELPEPLKRRVYRFGTLWGILEDGKWICERRVPILQNAEYIVEACTSHQCDVLPKEIDDLWEEEYVPLSKGIEYTGLLKVHGDYKTVLEILATQGLPSLTLPALPALPALHAPSTIPVKSTAHAAKSAQPTKPTHYNNHNHNHNHNTHNNYNHNPKVRTEKRCMISD